MSKPKHILTGSRLANAQHQAIEGLYEHTENPSGKFAFWSEEDSNNAVAGDNNLAKAILIDYQAIHYQILPLVNRANNWKETFGEEIPIGIDCETTGLSPYHNEFIGIGLAVPKTDSGNPEKLLYSTTIKDNQKQTDCFDCYFLVAPREPEKYQQYLSSVKELLSRLNPLTCWYLHNAKFDILWLYLKTGVMLNRIEDSMAMAYLLNEPSIAIDKLAPKYLGRYPTTLQRMTGKDKKDISSDVLYSVPIKEMGDYCCEDCIEGVLLSYCLREILSEEQTCVGTLLDLYEEYDRDSIHALVWAEAHGVKIDWDKLSYVGETLEAEMAALQEEVAIEAGLTLEESKLVCQSSEKLSRLLFEELQLPTEGIKKGKKGFYSTDKNTLNQLRFLHPIPNAIFDYRVLAKLKGTYVEGLHKREVNGYLHTTFNNCLTDTGRYSSSDPNLQNIPNPSRSLTGKLIRQCFIASEGNTLVKADYSQFELRILAHFSGDSYLIDCYQKNLDVHSVVTCLLFDIEFEQFKPDSDKEHKKKRTITKNINFGLIYGMTSRKLYLMAKDAGLDYDLQQCEDIMSRYWSRLPGVRDWMAANRLKAIRDGYTETVFGRRRYFEFQHPYLKALRDKPIELTYANWEALVAKKVTEDFRDQASFRQIGNAPIQGSNADCIRKAMKECFSTWYGLRTTAILTVHDEIVLESPIEHARETANELKRIMESVASGLRVPIKAEPTIALNWGDC